MNRLTIDRFEGEFAICESENDDIIQLPIALMPQGAAEGDIIYFDNERYEIDVERTELKRERARELLLRLKKSGK